MDKSKARLSPFRTYREFVASQRDDSDPMTYSRRYGEYKVGYARELVRRFFQQNSDFEWFTERYSPGALEARCAARRARAAENAAKFKSEASPSPEDAGLERAAYLAAARRASLDPTHAIEVDQEDDGELGFEASLQMSPSHKAAKCLHCGPAPASCTRKNLETAFRTAFEDAGLEDTVEFELFLEDHVKRMRDGFETEVWLVFQDADAAAACERALRDPEIRVESQVPPAVAMPPAHFRPPPRHHGDDDQEPSGPRNVLSEQDAAQRRERDAKMRVRECLDRDPLRVRPRRPLLVASNAGVDDFGRGGRARRFPRALCAGLALSRKNRLIRDARTATEVCAWLDLAAKVPEDSNFNSIIQSNTIVATSALARLDVAAAYLRRVHLFLYYSATFCRDDLDMLRRDAPWYTRAAPARASLDDDDSALLDPGHPLPASFDDDDDDDDVDPALADMDAALAAILADADRHRASRAAVATNDDAVVEEEEQGTLTKVNEDAAAAPMDEDDDDDDDDDRAEENKKRSRPTDAEKKPLESGSAVREDPATTKAKIAAEARRRSYGPIEPCPAWDAAVRAEAVDVEAATEEFMASHGTVEDQGRARCAFEWCHKLFKSDAFLRKHLANRHCDYLDAWLGMSKRPHMWRLYLADEAKPLPPLRGDNGAEISPVDLLKEAQHELQPPKRRLSDRANSFQGRHPRAENPRVPRSRDRDQHRSRGDHHTPRSADQPDQSRPDPRRLANYADVDAPKRKVLDLDFGVLLPPPAKKKKSSTTPKPKQVDQPPATT